VEVVCCRMSGSQNQEKKLQTDISPKVRPKGGSGGTTNISVKEKWSAAVHFRGKEERQCNRGFILDFPRVATVKLKTDWAKDRTSNFGSWKATKNGGGGELEEEKLFIGRLIQPLLLFLQKKRRLIVAGSGKGRKQLFDRVIAN